MGLSHPSPPHTWACLISPRLTHGPDSSLPASHMGLSLASMGLPLTTLGPTLCPDSTPASTCCPAPLQLRPPPAALPTPRPLDPSTQDTNDIFILAAKLIATTITSATANMQQQQGQGQQQGGSPGPGSGSSSAPAAVPGDLAGSLAPLRAAWLPFQLGWKRLWWDSVALPEDVEGEEEFRAQLRWVCRGG